MAEQNVIAWKQPLGDPACPYAFRWVLNLGIVAFRLHKWVGSDDPRYMHDHPYWFFTFVLKGSYDDVTDAGVEPMPRWTIRFRRATHKHTVKLTSPVCWTFLISGMQVRKWGFWIGEKFFRAEKFFAKIGHHPCETVTDGEHKEDATGQSVGLSESRSHH